MTLPNADTSSPLLAAVVDALPAAVSDTNPGAPSVRLARFYRGLSQVNQAIIRSTARERLFQAVCQALVDTGSFRMAMLAWHDTAHAELLPMAQAGDPEGVLQRMRAAAGPSAPGNDLAGLAYRHNSPQRCNRLQSDPRWQAWQPELLRHGLAACAAFPIREGGRPCGALTVCADQHDFFGDQETMLLSEAVANISFALDSFAREAAREADEHTLRSEMQFSETMLESMPGAVYLYDMAGRFLRWNRNFETVTGYSSQDIATMHPLDFFRPADHALATERISTVFSAGQATLEADFVARDGSARPYFFTGNRVSYQGRSCLVGVGIDISEQKRTEQALQVAELRFHTLFEQTPVGVVVIDPANAAIVECNQQAAQQLGYTQAELATLGIADIEAIDSRDQIQARIGALLTSGVAHFETRHRMKSGQVREVFVSGRAIELGGRPLIHCVFLDITVKKQAEQALRQDEQRIRSTLDGILEGCQVLDFDWRYQYLNHTAAAHNRRPNADLLGRTMPEMWPGIEQSDVYQLLRRGLEARIPLQDEIEFVFPDGSSGWYDVRVRPIPEGILVLTIDISERMQAERALRELNSQLEQKVAERTAELQAATARAESADHIKSAFLATMSHELRTPLNSIIGFTGILLQGLAGPLNPEQHTQLGMVRTSARHLLALVNDVLDISKIEAGQLEVGHAPFDIGRSINKVLALVGHQAREKGLDLRVVLPNGLGEMVSDARRFEQILLNLLSNAVKFTDQGEVRLSAELLQWPAGPAAGPQRPAIRLRVTDSGIGISPQDLPSLFQPFRQIDDGLARQHEGTGLGLAICHRLASLMGGDIHAESALGKGSTFSVTLPLNRLDLP